MDMIEDELRQTEILATAVAKTAALHQKKISNLVMMIILDDDDSSSNDESSSSDTSTTADSTVDLDDEEEMKQCGYYRNGGDEEDVEVENNQEHGNRKRFIPDDSIGSPPKRLRPCFDHDRVRNDLLSRYLGENPFYSEHDFKSMYGISRDRFKYIAEEVSKQNHSFYKPEGIRNETEPSIEAKLLFPLGVLKSGTELCATRFHFELSEEMAKESCEMFDYILHHMFATEYLRTPLHEDLENIRQRHNAAPGINKLFCTYEGRLVVWNKCPVGWRGNFDGDAANSPIVLKGVSDNQHWIWHAEFGLEDSVNNLRVLSQSPLPEGINLGKSGRRGIKRAFYVLQSKFQFLQKMWHHPNLSFDQIGNRIRTCILLHNMNISDRVMGGDVRARYDPNFSSV